MVDIISDVLSEYTEDPYYKADALLKLIEEYMEPLARPNCSRGCCGYNNDWDEEDEKE